MSSSVPEHDARLKFAVDAARQAGHLVMDYLPKSVAVQRKSDDSPVTVADRDAERLLRDLITRQFPDDGIIGEEHGVLQGTSGYRWILDPIDGTKSFIAGVPLFGTLVGLQYQRRSVLGVIELPALQRRVYAAEGQGAWWQIEEQPPQPARVSSCERLADGLYVTSEMSGFTDRGALDVHLELDRRAWYSRTWGDCYGYFLVATGQAAVMVDAALSIWDAAALLPILAEAGGTYTDWSGRVTVEGADGIGSNGRVLGEVLAVTRPYATDSPGT